MAQKDIKTDDPLELNYGNMNNDFFLLDYGFVMVPNPYDQIELRYHPSLLEAASVTVGINSPCFSSPTPWQSEFLSALKLDDQDSWASPNLKVYSSLFIFIDSINAYRRSDDYILTINGYHQLY